jgi:transcriptional regulator with XRE-family HTH domain
MKVGAPVGRNEIPTWSTLGVRIRELRHSRGWSQQALADRCGIGGEQISRYELGKETPSLSVLAWIAHAFGIEDMGELMRGVKAEDMWR